MFMKSEIRLYISRKRSTGVRGIERLCSDGIATQRVRMRLDVISLHKRGLRGMGSAVEFLRSGPLLRGAYFKLH